MRCIFIIVIFILYYNIACLAVENLSNSENIVIAHPIEDQPEQKESLKKENLSTSVTQMHKVWLWQESRDCLWNLAKKYYNDPWLWKKIYLANKNQIKDPLKIYPKQVLLIPPLDESEK